MWRLCILLFLILIIEIKNQSHDDDHLCAVMRITSSSSTTTFLIISFKLVQILVFIFFLLKYFSKICVCVWESLDVNVYFMMS